MVLLLAPIGTRSKRQTECGRERVAALLAAGALHTADDYRKAAFVFQHGDRSDDYLLAHTLALVAVAKGDQGAAWIAAATLDRYLQSVRQPQIYGTQYLGAGRLPRRAL